MCVHHLSLVGWLSVGESPAVSSYSRGEFIYLAVHGKHRHPLAKGCGNWFKSYTCDYLRVLPAVPALSLSAEPMPSAVSPHRCEDLLARGLNAFSGTNLLGKITPFGRAGAQSSEAERHIIARVKDVIRIKSRVTNIPKRRRSCSFQHSKTRPAL
jgi:hypothetical protein